MKRPFNIFPSFGYRNSQFQIVSTVDNLRIDIYDQAMVVKSIETNSKYPTLLTSLNSTGKLTAKCSFNNEIFEQVIEIKEAFRLGSSEFKKAFVFEDTNYSFFLMKDRLLLYDEEKRYLLTENHYSPTEIHKINKHNFLFLTKVGSLANGIINLGIYNTESFSIVGELLNDYKEIKILPETNKAWLVNKKTNTIHCFELAKTTNCYFLELAKYDGFNDFFLDNSLQCIFINYNEYLKIKDINNLHEEIEIPKLPENAIDKAGNVYTVARNSLTCKKNHTDYFVSIKLSFKINLQAENFIHIGNNLKSEFEFIALNEKTENIKKDIIPSIPEIQSYYYHSLPESQRISEAYTTHRIYPTTDGIFILQEEVKRNFVGVTFRKHLSNWSAIPNTFISNEFSLSFLSGNKVEVLIDKTSTLSISEYHNSMLLINFQNQKMLFSGSKPFTLENESTIELLLVNGIEYFLIKSMDKYTLYQTTNLKVPILDQIDILNPTLIKEHQILWYRGKAKYVSNTNYLNAFDLKSCSKILIDEQKLQHSLFKDASDFKFYNRYALSSNQIVFNPISLEIKDTFIGTVESYSQHLNKIVSYRANNIYLSVFNIQTGKYELLEIPIDDTKYKESYLSPNGQFLVIQDESNKYAFYDIEKSEIIEYISGNFLAFSKDGSLIVEKDSKRAVKIIDPTTFQDITPPNYHHYRFLSPDGMLYAQVAYKSRYFNKLNGNELTPNEVSKFRQDLDDPIFFLQEKEKEQTKHKIEKNRMQIFESHKQKFEEFGIEDYANINSQTIVKVKKFTEIGIVGTQVTTEIQFPDDLAFYNYSAFSYDNKYFGYVGKSSSNGLIHLFKIEFDEVNIKLLVSDTYLSRYPRRASWVCGFSKTGSFATYDSTPDTYIINVAENLFVNKTSETELRENIVKSKFNIYHTYDNWNEIKGKNFLCFSPTGDFLALSEQGYEPLTLGGYGHQESNVVHIAQTTNGKVIDSFTGHGDKIKDNFQKKITFVAFSEDEKRIMTLSADGVVIIRDINININEKGVKTLATILSRHGTPTGLGIKKRSQKKDIFEDKRLIEFYNLKIKHSAILPEKDDNIVSNNSNKLSWDFLLEHCVFFNQLFSTYYPFTENELLRFQKIISIGSPYLSLDSGSIHCHTIFGLIFNDTVQWTEKLKELYYEKPQVLYAGGSRDEYSFEIEFDQLPLNLIEELESIKSNLHEETFIDDQGYCNLNLYNGYYDYILEKTEFSAFELTNIMQRDDKFLYIANRYVYLNYLKYIYEEIPDFSIEKFFEKCSN